MMRKIKILVVFCMVAASVFAQPITPVDAASSVKFTIRNFGLNVNGSFSGLQGRILFDAARPANASFSVTADASSVNTGNSSRDKHLKKEDYFHVSNYPTLSFVSVKVTAAEKAGTYNMEGNLTIKGITKSVSFPFTAIATANGYVFTGQFRINRRDFKVGGNSWVLSDDLLVSLNVTANR